MFHLSATHWIKMTYNSDQYGLHQLWKYLLFLVLWFPKVSILFMSVFSIAFSILCLMWKDYYIGENNTLFFTLSQQRNLKILSPGTTGVELRRRSSQNSPVWNSVSKTQVVTGINVPNSRSAILLRIGDKEKSIIFCIVQVPIYPFVIYGIFGWRREKKTKSPFDYCILLYACLCHTSSLEITWNGFFLLLYSPTSRKEADNRCSLVILKNWKMCVNPKKRMEYIMKVNRGQHETLSLNVKGQFSEDSSKLLKDS